MGLENICMLLYTTSDYYGIIVGAKGDIVLFLIIFKMRASEKFEKSPFKINTSKLNWNNCLLFKIKINTLKNGDYSYKAANDWLV